MFGTYLHHKRSTLFPSSGFHMRETMMGARMKEYLPISTLSAVVPAKC